MPRMVGADGPARVAAAGAAAPLTSVEFRRLMGISRPPDSSRIKSHFSDCVNLRLSEEQTGKGKEKMCLRGN